MAYLWAIQYFSPASHGISHKHHSLLFYWVTQLVSKFRQGDQILEELTKHKQRTRVFHWEILLHSHLSYKSRMNSVFIRFQQRWVNRHLYNTLPINIYWNLKKVWAKDKPKAESENTTVFSVSLCTSNSQKPGYF